MIAAVTSWPQAAVWIALILGIFGVPIAGARHKRNPIGRRELRDLQECQYVIHEQLAQIHDELVNLRRQVDEMDRVLKAVE